MSKKFPHLVDDTNFPDDNIKVFSQYQNTINYDDISDNTTFRLHNVNWCETDNYKVLWENENIRDKYFDDNTLFSGTTESIVWPSEGRVKLPIDWFTSLNDYNYLTVIITHNQQAMRLFYFVQNFEFITRDVTELNISLDYWTTYITKINIKQFNLTRGHIATTWITPEEFLTDPIANNKGLLSSDVMANGDKTVKTQYVNMDNGRPYMLLALLANPTDFNDVPQWIKTETYDTNFAGNTSQWAPARMAQSQDRPCANNYWIIGLPANQAEELLWYWCQYYQPLLNSIRAAYIVGENMLNKGKQYGFGSITVYEILPTTNIELSDITFTVDDFNYPIEYKNLAKLYTSPYASFEITSVNGNTQKFNIQGLTRNTKLVRTGNNIYPTLQVSTYLQGYNDTTSVNYDWISITGNVTNVVHGGNAFAFMVNNFAIPTFELRMRADWAGNLEQGNGLHQVKIAADTGLTNANASADTALTNANASADAALANAYAGFNTQTDNMKIAIKATTDIKEENRQLLYDINDYQNTKIDADATQDKALQINALLAQESSVAASQVASSAAGSLSMAASTISMGLLLGGPAGAVIGAAGGIAGAAVNMALSGYNASVTLSNNQLLNTASQETITNKAEYAKSYNGGVMGRQQRNLDNNNKYSTEASKNQNTNTVATGKANADRSNITAKSNANRVNTTTKANANRSNLVAQESAHTAYYQARVSAPRALTQDGGDMQSAMDMTRGVTVNLNILNSSDLKTVGDTFLTYGYQYDTTLINPSLKCKPHFEYWQGEPIFTGAIPSTAREMITAIFTNGVTLYNTPDDIGHSIYDNN